MEWVNRVAKSYTELLKNVARTPVVPEGYLSSWAQYTVQLESRVERDDLQAALKSQGIPAMVYYPIPLHMQKAFAGKKTYQECPVTERLCETVLSLPMHPYMKKEDVEMVAEVIRDFLAG